MNRTSKSLTATLALGCVIATAACSTKANDKSSSGSGKSGSIKTDVGVTDTEITLGVQTDMSGVFKSIGLGLTHGNQMWADDVNADGGICGRKIALDIQDNAYKADNAVPLYETQKTKVLGFLQLIGSPVLAALKTKIVSDDILTIPAAQASSNMGEPAIMLIGATYDVEMVNGLAWMQSKGMIADGDKIGHIYVDSEYGQNGLLGSKAYAKDHNITVIEAPVAATDTDMTATITKMKSEGVKVIALTTTPSGTASAAVQNAAQGLNVPLLGNDPTFSAEILKDATVATAVGKLYVSAGTAAFGHEGELTTKIKDEYMKKYSADTPNYAVNAGYQEGLVWEAVLKQACSNGDLTQAGAVKARQQVKSVDTKGIAGTMDLSEPGNPTPRATFIEQPDPAIASTGGLKVVEDLYSSEAAKKYKAPNQK